MPSCVAIERCRVSGGHNLIPMLGPGEQASSGVFPRRPESGLLRLAHSFDLGGNHGLRSGPGRSAVERLTQKGRELEPFPEIEIV